MSNKIITAMLLVCFVQPLAAQWQNSSLGSTDPKTQRLRTVQGKIFNEKGSPISGAAIMIENSKRRFHREVRSDQRGLWRMTGILAMPGEEFRITINATRYLTRTGAINFFGDKLNLSTEMHADPRLELTAFFAQAEQARRNHQFSEALPLYEQILVIDMNNHSANLGIGICRLQLGQLAPAEEQLLQALSMAKAAADVGFTAMTLEYLGDLAVKRSFFAQAKDYFTQALEKAAARPELWEKLGDTCGLLQQPDEASVNYQKALALQADMPGVAAKLARQKDIAVSSAETAETTTEKTESAARPSLQVQLAPPASDEQLAAILKLAANYCQRLETAAFRYFCTEAVEEETWPGRPNASQNRYQYDFQIVGKKQTLYEQRTLLQENGRRVKEKKASQKTVFQTSLMFFSPIDLLAAGNQPLFSYRLLGTERVGNQDCQLLEVRAKRQST